MSRESSPTIFMDMTEQFVATWSDQLDDVSKNLVQLELTDGGLLREVQHQSVKDPNSVIPRIVTLETSLSEVGGIVWHVSDNKTHTQYDIDAHGATELRMDLQGNVLTASETDKTTHVELMDLVTDILEHPVTLMKFEKLDKDATNPDLQAMREKLESKYAQLTSEENKVYQKLKLLGKLSVGGASKNNRIAIVSRQVYTGRAGTLLSGQQ